MTRETIFNEIERIHTEMKDKYALAFASIGNDALIDLATNIIEEMDRNFEAFKKDDLSDKQLEEAYKNILIVKEQFNNTWEEFKRLL